MPNIDDVFERTIRLDERVSSIDKKIDHLIEVASAAPAAAGYTPPPAESAEAGEETLPNNPSALTAWVVNKFGKYRTPILVIVTLSSIYLLAQEGASRINQRNESIRQQVVETAIATMATGLKVVESTDKLIDLNKKLGETGQELLDLQRKAADEAGKAVTEKQKAERALQNAQELRNKLTAKENLLNNEKKTVKAKDEQLTMLRISLTKEEQKLKRAKADLETERTALAKERGEIKLAQANVATREGLLRAKDAQLSETQAMITSLKEDLKRLRGKGQDEQTRSRKELTELRAKLAKLQASQTSSQSQIAALEKQREELIDSLKIARTTIENLGAATASVPKVPELKVPEPAPEPKKPSQIEVVAETLRRYAKDSNAVTRDEWRRLDDEKVTPAELDALLKTDLGYEFVLKVSTVETDNSVEKAMAVYIPVRRTTSEQFIGIPALRINENGKEWDVESPVASFTFVRLRDLADFNRTRVAAIIDISKSRRRNDAETVLKFQSDKNSVTFSDVLKKIFTQTSDLKVKSIDVHFGGPEKVVRILGMADAAAKFPDLVKRWIRKDKRVAVVKEMEDRAIKFDADKLILAEPFGAETTLRAALVRLIGAAVSGDTPAASPLLTKPLTVRDLGRLAAIALRGELVFDKPPDVQVAQTKATPGTAADPPPVPGRQCHRLRIHPPTQIASGDRRRGVSLPARLR